MTRKLPSPARFHKHVPLVIERLEERSLFDASYYPLASWYFWQDWSDTSQITVDDDWSGVLSTMGYRGDGLTGSAGVDPRTVLAFAGPGGPVPNVQANRINPDTLVAGGAAEFHLEDPAVALKGSATARAPFLLFHVDTTGVTATSIYLELRDLDGSANNVQSQVTIQYRVGETGPFANVPDGYVADASAGPFQSGLVTPLWVTLPSAANNQPQVQIRILTTDALGFDEWIGVDTVYMTATPLPPPPESLRMVSYNVAAAGGQQRPGLETVLQALGDEAVGGRARPIDVLALQEVEYQQTTTEYVVGLLNGLYGTGVYARGTLNGGSTGSGTQGIVYNSQTIQLLGEAAIGTASTTGQPRQTLRYHLRPLSTNGGADFVLYNSHYKAANDATSRNRRLVEARAIRTDADSLGAGVNVFYAGDFNVYTSTELAYQHLQTAGDGRAFDPIDRPGSWHANSAFVGIFTQAPAINPPPGLTGGGLDDRFDFQLFTAALTDSYGLDYRLGTYHTFGVNGSVPRNGAINDPRNTALPELPNRLEVLDLLAELADHLPVVADYDIGPGMGPDGRATGATSAVRVDAALLVRVLTEEAAGRAVAVAQLTFYQMRQVEQAKGAITELPFAAPARAGEADFIVEPSPRVSGVGEGFLELASSGAACYDWALIESGEVGIC